MRFRLMISGTESEPLDPRPVSDQRISTELPAEVHLDQITDKIAESVTGEILAALEPLVRDKVNLALRMYEDELLQASRRREREKAGIGLAYTLPNCRGYTQMLQKISVAWMKRSEIREKEALFALRPWIALAPSRLQSDAQFPEILFRYTENQLKSRCCNFTPSFRSTQE